MSKPPLSIPAILRTKEAGVFLTPIIFLRFEGARCIVPKRDKGGASPRVPYRAQSLLADDIMPPSPRPEEGARNHAAKETEAISSFKEQTSLPSLFLI